MLTLTEVIRSQSEKYERVENLMRCVTVKSLTNAHRKQNGRKAMGADGITKDEYNVNLEENLTNLVKRMKKFSYQPQPVRRVYIPKANGKMRPLGIPSYEDKLVQSVMADILTGVYEPRFLDCSYGFRPGRSCHQVVKIIDDTAMAQKVNYVLDADIKGFFDNIDHGWMMTFLEHDIADRNFLRYIKRFLKAGVMEEGKRLKTDRGSAQGGLISPVMCNAYLHYVLDLWFEKVVKKQLKGFAKLVRYADDFLIMFQKENEAKMVMELLPERLRKFGLEVAVDKTRIIPFGRFDKGNNRFDFLGFTFYGAKTRKGKFRVGIKTSEAKLKTKRRELKQWLWSKLHADTAETMQSLNRRLTGHCNYYSVNGNLRSIRKFYLYAKNRTYWMLNRRSQKNSVTWETMNKLWEEYITPPRIKVNIWQHM